MNTIWNVLAFVLIGTVTAASTDVERSCKIEGGVQDSVVMMNNGLAIPRVALGVYQTSPGSETYQAVKVALATGYRHIDTGDVVCDHETVHKANCCVCAELFGSCVALQRLYTETKRQ